MAKRTRSRATEGEPAAKRARVDARLAAFVLPSAGDAAQEVWRAHVLPHLFLLEPAGSDYFTSTALSLVSQRAQELVGGQRLPLEHRRRFGWISRLASRLMSTWTVLKGSKSRGEQWLAVVITLHRIGHERGNLAIGVDERLWGLVATALQRPSSIDNHCRLNLRQHAQSLHAYAVVMNRDGFITSEADLVSRALFSDLVKLDQAHTDLPPYFEILAVEPRGVAFIEARYWEAEMRREWFWFPWDRLFDRVLADTPWGTLTPLGAAFQRLRQSKHALNDYRENAFRSWTLKQILEALVVRGCVEHVSPVPDSLFHESFRESERVIDTFTVHVDDVRMTQWLWQEAPTPVRINIIAGLPPEVATRLWPDDVPTPRDTIASLVRRALEIFNFETARVFAARVTPCEGTAERYEIDFQCAFLKACATHYIPWGLNVYDRIWPNGTPRPYPRKIYGVLAEYCHFFPREYVEGLIRRLQCLPRANSVYSKIGDHRNLTLALATAQVYGDRFPTRQHLSDMIGSGERLPVDSPYSIFSHLPVVDGSSDSCGEADEEDSHSD